MEKKRLHILACDAFSYELESLRKQIDLPALFACEITVKYLTQRLHVDFQQLEQAVNMQLSLTEADAIILLYGRKCHPDFASFLPANVLQIEEKNCMHAISGLDTEDRPRTFFLNPLQVKKWREFFAYDEKSDEQKATFKENFCKYCDDALYTDTGTQAVSKEELAAFTQATGLPVQRRDVDLTPFKNSLFAAIKKALV